MQRRRTGGIVATGLLLCMGSVRGAVTIEPLQGESAAAGALPTVAEAQSDLDNGRYTWCLQKIGRLLNTKPPPSGEEQCTLLSLKGECLLQDREAGPAWQAFTAAAAAATEKGSIAEATATATLVQRSSNYTYIPVTGKDRRPVSMLDKKKRRAALAALWADELAKVKPNVDVALKSPDSESAVNVAGHVRELSKFELAATEGSSTCDGMIKSLQEHTEALLAETILQWNTAAENMTNSAARMVTVGATADLPAHTQRQGLTGEEKAKISDMLTAIGKLGDQVKTLTVSMGADPALYAPDLAATEVLAKRLHGMLLGVYRPARAATRPAPAAAVH